MKLLSLVSFCALAILCKGGPDEKNLIRELFKDYEPLSRPVHDDTQTVGVKMGLILLDVDMKDGVFRARVWHKFEWNDQYMQWDPSEYGNVKYIHLPIAKVWSPDILLYNDASKAAFLNIRTDVHHVVIKSDGSLTYIPQNRVESTCQKSDDPKNQTCTLKYGSWTYDEAMVNLGLQDPEVDLSLYTENKCLKMLSTSVERHAKVYPFAPDKTYVDLEYKFTMERLC